SAEDRWGRRRGGPWLCPERGWWRGWAGSRKCSDSWVVSLNDWGVISSGTDPAESRSARFVSGGCGVGRGCPGHFANVQLPRDQLQLVEGVGDVLLGADHFRAQRTGAIALA